MDQFINRAIWMLLAFGLSHELNKIADLLETIAEGVN
jgi:hypothetical protein